MIKYSIVIPVYNAEKSLDLLYNRIRNVFEKEIREEFELILVDDCSSDKSYEIIKTLTEKDSRIIGVQLAKNHGQQKAVLCGMRYTSGEYVITMDDDLQHPPEEIPKLIKKIRETDNIDVVIGAYAAKKHNIIRKLGSKLMDMSSNMIFKKPKNLKLTSFRIIKRFVIDYLTKVNISSPTVGPLLLQTTSRIVNITVRHEERRFGHSGYTFLKLCKIFLKNLTTNSDIPLKFIGKIGILSFITSISLILFYMLKFFIYGTSVQGWTTIIVLLLFFGGMNLFAIGILGKYIINIIQESKKMPMFIVKQVNNAEDK